MQKLYSHTDTLLPLHHLILPFNLNVCLSIPSLILRSLALTFPLSCALQVRVTVPPETSDNDCITLTGRQANVEKARAMLEKIQVRRARVCVCVYAGEGACVCARGRYHQHRYIPLLAHSPTLLVRLPPPPLLHPHIHPYHPPPPSYPPVPTRANPGGGCEHHDGGGRCGAQATAAAARQAHRRHRRRLWNRQHSLSPRCCQVRQGTAVPASNRFQNCVYLCVHVGLCMCVRCVLSLCGSVPVSPIYATHACTDLAPPTRRSLSAVRRRMSPKPRLPWSRP